MDQKAISSDLIRGHIDTIILHTLLSGDLHAQQISDAIEKKSQNEYKINQATLYSSLKRLETLKHVTSYWNDSNDGGRRKFFKLTESGKTSVQDSLLNWSYSRTVIDKLMDCEPTQTIKIIEKVVERPVEVPVPISQPVINESITVPPAIKNDIKPIEHVEKAEIVQEKPLEPAQATTESNQDFNFRTVLNGLVSPSRTKKSQKKAKEEKQAVVLEPIKEPVVEKPKFTQTINQIDYNSHRTNNGKIDFGDVVLKAEKEGFKVRISSKDSPKPQGTLLINKLNLYSSLFLYLVMLIEVLLYQVIFKAELNASYIEILIAIGVISIFPAVRAIMFLANSKRLTLKKVTPDSILTASIVAFNLLLVTLAVALLSDINLEIVKNLLLYIAIPATVCVDIVIYFVAKYILSKQKIFDNRTKKTA